MFNLARPRTNIYKRVKSKKEAYASIVLESFHCMHANHIASSKWQLFSSRWLFYFSKFCVFLLVQKELRTVGKKLFILVYKYHIKTPKLFKHQQKLLLLIKKNAHTHYCHSLHHIVNFRVFWKNFVTHSKSKIFFFPISFEPLFILAINKRSHFM